MSLILRSCFLLVSLLIDRGRCSDVVMDCDPGTDDAMGLLLLTSRVSRASLLTVTTVTGNIGAVNTSVNALLTLWVANRTDVPVYEGSGQGLVVETKQDYYFGYDGLGDVFPNKPKLRTTQHSAAALADLVKRRPGEITVIATGPLTNLALAIHLNPNFMDQVKELYFLGGSYLGGGNMRPGVEFNVGKDAEAAAFVFSKVPENKPIIVIPKETVDDIAMSLQWRLNVLGQLDTCQIKFLNKADITNLYKTKSFIPYDQTAVLSWLNPEIILSTRDSYFSVETCGNLGKGAVFRDDSTNKTNVKIITKVDKGLVKQKLVEYLGVDSGNCVE